MSMIEHILIVWNTLGIMALCTMIYGFCQRKIDVGWMRRLLIGVTLGLGAALMMMQPLQLSSGFQADSRTAFVGMAAAFGGWIGGTSAVVIIVASRFWIGGDGTTLGIAITLATSILAGTWRAFHPTRTRTTNLHLLSLSALLIIPLCLSFVRPETAHLPIVLLLAVLTYLNVLLFGSLMDYEQKRGRHERALRLAALTDPLTAIPNRRAFEEALDKRIGQRRQALFIVDIDHFKNINDTHGHDAGDFILRRCASVLPTCLRADDIVARLGGEEFGIIIAVDTKDEALERAEALCGQLRAEVVYEEKSISVSVSIGGYYSADREFASDYYLRRADEALYKAKRTGRDRTVLVGS